MPRTVISKKDVMQQTAVQIREAQEISPKQPKSASPANLEVRPGKTPKGEPEEHFEFLPDDGKEYKIKYSRETIPYSGTLEGSTVNTTPRPDSYTERLLKYIPGEVIALYLTLDAIIRSTHKVGTSLHWSIFVFGALGTFLYLWQVGKVRKRLQLSISVISYGVWVFALSGPFVTLSWYDPIYAGILLPCYTFLVSIIEA